MTIELHHIFIGITLLLGSLFSILIFVAPETLDIRSPNTFDLIMAPLSILFTIIARFCVERIQEGLKRLENLYGDNPDWLIYGRVYSMRCHSWVTAICSFGVLCILTKPILQYYDHLNSMVFALLNSFFLITFSICLYILIDLCITLGFIHETIDKEEVNAI